MREQRYEITEQPDWSVLDGLNHIKDELDPTLTYRWSCRMEICGSCGMMIDGEPRLACSTFLPDFQSPLRIAPLAHSPVIRDLVIEYDGFLHRLRAAELAERLEHGRVRSSNAIGFARAPLGRFLVAGAIVLPLWNEAFNLRHTAVDLLGTSSNEAWHRAIEWDESAATDERMLAAREARELLGRG